MLIPLEAQVDAMTQSLLDPKNPLHELCWEYLSLAITISRRQITVSDVPSPINGSTVDIVVKHSLRRILAEADRTSQSALRIPYGTLTQYYREISSRIGEGTDVDRSQGF